MDFDRMSVKDLERRLANCLPGSLNHSLIVPVLEAKRRRTDAVRTWIFFCVGAVIAVAGLLAKLGR